LLGIFQLDLSIDIGIQPGKFILAQLSGVRLDGHQIPLLEAVGKAGGSTRRPILSTKRSFVVAPRSAKQTVLRIYAALGVGAR
jgi:hypothetical protein